MRCSFGSVPPSQITLKLHFVRRKLATIYSKRLHSELISSLAVAVQTESLPIGLIFCSVVPTPITTISLVNGNFTTYLLPQETLCRCFSALQAGLTHLTLSSATTTDRTILALAESGAAKTLSNFTLGGHLTDASAELWTKFVALDYLKMDLAVSSATISMKFVKGVCKHQQLSFFMFRARVDADQVVREALSIESLPNLSSLHITGASISAEELMSLVLARKDPALLESLDVSGRQVLSASQALDFAKRLPNLRRFLFNTDAEDVAWPGLSESPSPIWAVSTNVRDVSLPVVESRCESLDPLAAAFPQLEHLTIRVAEGDQKALVAVPRSSIYKFASFAHLSDLELTFIRFQPILSLPKSLRHLVASFRSAPEAKEVDALFNVFKNCCSTTLLSLQVLFQQGMPLSKRHLVLALQSFPGLQSLYLHNDSKDEKATEIFKAHHHCIQSTSILWTQIAGIKLVVPGFLPAIEQFSGDPDSGYAPYLTPSRVPRLRGFAIRATEKAEFLSMAEMYSSAARSGMKVEYLYCDYLPTASASDIISRIAAFGASLTVLRLSGYVLESDAKKLLQRLSVLRSLSIEVKMETEDVDWVKHQKVDHLELRLRYPVLDRVPSSAREFVVSSEHFPMLATVQLRMPKHFSFRYSRLPRLVLATSTWPSLSAETEEPAGCAPYGVGITVDACPALRALNIWGVLMKEIRVADSADLHTLDLDRCVVSNKEAFVADVTCSRLHRCCVVTSAPHVPFWTKFTDDLKERNCFSEPSDISVSLSPW